MEAVLLEAAGLPHHQIAALVGVSENTLRSYLARLWPTEGRQDTLETTCSCQR